MLPRFQFIDCMNLCNLQNNILCYQWKDKLMSCKNKLVYHYFRKNEFVSRTQWTCITCLLWTCIACFRSKFPVSYVWDPVRISPMDEKSYQDAFSQWGLSLSQMSKSKYVRLSDTFCSVFRNLFLSTFHEKTDRMID